MFILFSRVLYILSWAFATKRSGKRINIMSSMKMIVFSPDERERIENR